MGKGLSSVAEHLFCAQKVPGSLLASLGKAERVTSVSNSAEPLLVKADQGWGGGLDLARGPDPYLPHLLWTKFEW